MSSACCYICLGSNTKKQFAENKGCLCKGSVAIHNSCFKKWASSAENPFACSVCKADYSISFLSKFLSLEQFMFSRANLEDDEDEEDEDYEENYMEEQVLHGVPVLVDEDRYIYFEHPFYESIFMHSNKMELKGVRQSCEQQSKKQHYKNNHRARQYNRVPFSRKR